MPKNTTFSLGNIALIDKIASETDFFESVLGSICGRSRSFIPAVKLLISNKLNQSVSINKLLDLHHRQVATHLTFHRLRDEWDIGMPAAGEDSHSLKNAWKKTNEQHLFTELETEYGFPRATCRSLVQLMHEFIEENYGNLRNDAQIIYPAVSSDEPPGKPLDRLRLVPVKLTVSSPEDAGIIEQRGISGLRKHKLIRFANEAYDQGGLLIHLERGWEIAVYRNQLPTGLVCQQKNEKFVG
jgi:hypothetical protein